MSLKSKQKYHSINNSCKQYINSLFGMMAAKNITDENDFTNTQGKVKLNEEIFQKKIALDYDAVYWDTDSVQHLGNHNDFNECNKK